ADLEQEIAQRKDEIGKLEADFSETTMVKERLQLAEQLGKPDPERAKRSTGSPPVAATTAATTPAATAAPAAPSGGAGWKPAPAPAVSASGTGPSPSVSAPGN